MSVFTSLLLLSTLVVADVVPTAPGPGEVFNAGQDCVLKWNADTTGSWMNMTIFLMAGPNDAMQTVKTVAHNLDGTDVSLSPFTWTCPIVDPYSDIYFYQLTSTDEEGKTVSAWTTRFTIASLSGETTPPEHPSQPNGQPVPWGESHTMPETATIESTPEGSEPSDRSSNDEDIPGTAKPKPKSKESATPIDNEEPAPPTLGLPPKAQNSIHKHKVEAAESVVPLRETSGAKVKDGDKQDLEEAIPRPNATTKKIHRTMSESWMSASKTYTQVQATASSIALDVPGANSLPPASRDANSNERQSANLASDGQKMRSGRVGCMWVLIVVYLLS